MIKYMTWFQCIFKHDTRKRMSLDRMSFHSFGQGILYINTQRLIWVMEVFLPLLHEISNS